MRRIAALVSTNSCSSDPTPALDAPPSRPRTVIATSLPTSSTWASSSSSSRSAAKKGGGLVSMTDAFAQCQSLCTQQCDPSPTIDRLVKLVVGHGDQIAGCSSQRLQLYGRFSDGDTRQSAAPKYAVQEGVSRHFGIILRKHVSAPAYLIRADPIARRESPHATTQRDAFLA